MLKVIDFIEKHPLLIILFIASMIFSVWLLQENGPWDVFVFIFIALPVNLIFLTMLIIRLVKSNKFK